MEALWENWISSLEMGEDSSNGQSHHMNYFDQDHKLHKEIKVLSPPKFFSSFESVQHSSTSTMQYNNNNTNDNNGFTSTTTPSTIDSTSLLSYEDASFDDGTMLKSNSSNSLISQDVASLEASLALAAPSPSTFILSFEKSSVEPLLHDRPNNSSTVHLGGGATSSSIMCPKRTTLSNNNNVMTSPKAEQGTKKLRTSSEIQDHIMAERKRRQELTEKFIALSATIPGLKKTDKAYILREAIIYTKQLQERVKELESQNKRRRLDSIMFVKRSVVGCEISNSVDRGKGRGSTAPPQVEARVLGKEVLIGIHCERQKDIVLKIMALLQNLQLSLTSSSVLPFGTSSLKVTVIAQMDEKYCMTVDDLVKNLRQDILKSYT